MFGFSANRYKRIVNGVTDLFSEPPDWLNSVTFMVGYKGRLELTLNICGYTFVIIPSQDHPFRSPHICVTECMYHPNIPPDGCFRINDWCPIFSFRQISLILYCMLIDPDPDCDVNKVAHHTFMLGEEKYKLVKKHYEKHWDKLRWFYMQKIYIPEITNYIASLYLF